MARRSGIGARRRWKIMARDGFTCRYCGGNATTGARLVVDHIHSVAEGGSNHDDNLVTACWVCNAGKSSLSLLPPPPVGTGLDVIRSAQGVPLDKFDRLLDMLAHEALRCESGIVNGVKSVAYGLAMASAEITGTPYDEKQAEIFENSIADRLKEWHQRGVAEQKASTGVR